MEGETVMTQIERFKAAFNRLIGELPREMSYDEIRYHVDEVMDNWRNPKRPDIHEVVRDAMCGVPECEEHLRRRG